MWRKLLIHMLPQHPVKWHSHLHTTKRLLWGSYLSHTAHESFPSVVLLRLQSHVVPKTGSRPLGFNYLHSTQSFHPSTLCAHSFCSIMCCSLLYQSQMGNLSSPVSHMNPIYHLPVFEINLLAGQLPTLFPWLLPIHV